MKPHFFTDIPYKNVIAFIFLLIISLWSLHFSLSWLDTACACLCTVAGNGGFSCLVINEVVKCTQLTDCHSLQMSKNVTTGLIIGDCMKSSLYLLPCTPAYSGGLFFGNKLANVLNNILWTCILHLFLFRILTSYPNQGLKPIGLIWCYEHPLDLPGYL